MKEIELLKIIFKDSPDILEPLNKIDKEIERLNNIINKAIEYIGLNEEDLKLYDIYDVNGIELLNILRGEDNE